jgi:endonuclease III
MESEREKVFDPDRIKKLIKTLIMEIGGKFSTQLGIDLSRADPDNLFRWFLASKLFAARISTEIAIKTYKTFERNGVISPGKILETGWDGLVKLLDDGGYVRYDFSTATRLLAITKDLQDKYRGELNLLHQEARDKKDLENRLKELGKGIGDVMVNIFLRELRGVWEKADPPVSELAILGAERIGLLESKKPWKGGEALTGLKEIWHEYGCEVDFERKVDFCDFETALLRTGKDFCKKTRCDTCPIMHYCIYQSKSHKNNSIRGFS